MQTEVVHLLLLITWAIHYCLVIILIGTPLLALIQRLVGREGRALAFLRSPAYPACISLTITTGVAPLLFSQVLFHRHFYRTFILLNPWPLIGLALLIGFFYLSYWVVAAKRRVWWGIVVQIVLLVSFAAFFGAVYKGTLYPARHAGLFWAGQGPGWLWHSTVTHVIVALVGASLFFALARRGWAVRTLPLLILALIASLVREVIRAKVLGDDFPQPIAASLDPSIVVFLVCFATMIWVLVKAVRIAFSGDRDSKSP